MSRPALDEPTGAERLREPQSETASSDRWTPRWLSWSLIASAGLVFLAWLFLSVMHVDDRYQLDHVSGARIALAQRFNDGTLYPELYDGRLYGGTRFMPIPIVVHGLVARLTDDYVVSGKLVSYAFTAALVATMFVLLRRLRCPFALAVALPALVLTTATGLSGSMNARADVLPLLLQVIAVGIVADTARRGPTIAAGALAGVAFMSKLSAVWAPVAIVIWLFARDRKRTPMFAVAFVATAGALLALFTVITDGRILENVFGLSTSGVTGLRSILLTPYRFVHLMVDQMTTAWAVIPLVGLAAWTSMRFRAASIWLVSLLCALGVVLVVLTDVGTGFNQLIDIVVLIAIVIGEFVGRLWDEHAAIEAGTARILQTVIVLVLLWVTLSGLAVTFGPDVETTLQGQVSFDPEPLAGLEPPPRSVLSDDPYVPVSLGQVPVVLDAFMLPRLADEHPDAIPDLVERIDAREFDLIVLVEPLEPVERSWWTEQHFGIDVARAMSRAYTYVGRMQGYHLYEPNADTAT
ncbi:MAG TPA: glycosyltransferase family 87 protein [Actinomycetota bacterium]|nr:glycosyltransferase family 87 protein [Actinomycetota bacterium]